MRLKYLCLLLNMVLFEQIHLWPGPESQEGGGLFSCYVSGAHVMGRKEGSGFCIDCSPRLSKVLLMPAFCPWKGCPLLSLGWARCVRSCSVLTLLPSCFHLLHHIKNMPRALMGILPQCCAINGSCSTGAWCIFSYISVDCLISYYFSPYKCPKLLVTLLFHTSVATL